MTEPDKLGGLHAVVALTQDSINFQLSQLHKRGIIKPRLQISPGDTGIELDAALAPPTIAFALAHRQRAAVLTLPLPVGTLVCWEGFGPKAVRREVPIADWRLAFTVNLDLQDIAAERLNSGAVPEEVKKHLAQFSPDIFTIRHLFLDFGNANLVELDLDRTQMPLPRDAKPSPGMIQQAQEALRAYIATLRGDDNPFILGYAVDVKPQKPVDGPLAATAGTFSTFVDKRTDGMSTLNYLLMTDHVALPTAPSTGLFESNWVRSTTLDGRMVIAHSRFWSAWLHPQLAGQLGDATETDTGWSFEHVTDGKRRVLKDFGRVMGFPIDVTVTNTFTNTATVTCRNTSETSVGVRIAGVYVARRQYEAKPLGIYEMFAELATIHWTIDLTLAAGPAGTIVVAPAIEIEPTEYTVDGTVLGKWDANFPSNRNLLEKDAAQLDTQMRALLATLKPGQITQRVVMPTGATMSLKNVQLDSARNVLVDISYVSSN